MTQQQPRLRTVPRRSLAPCGSIHSCPVPSPRNILHQLTHNSYSTICIPLCQYIHIYIYVYILIYTHIYIYVYMCIYQYIYIYICIHTYIQRERERERATFVYIYIYIYIQICIISLWMYEYMLYSINSYYDNYALVFQIARKRRMSFSRRASSGSEGAGVQSFCNC